MFPRSAISASWARERRLTEFSQPGYSGKYQRGVKVRRDVWIALKQLREAWSQVASSGRFYLRLIMNAEAERVNRHRPLFERLLKRDLASALNISVDRIRIISVCHDFADEESHAQVLVELVPNEADVMVAMDMLRSIDQEESKHASFIRAYPSSSVDLKFLKVPKAPTTVSNSKKAEDVTSPNWKHPSKSCGEMVKQVSVKGMQSMLNSAPTAPTINMSATTVDSFSTQFNRSRAVVFASKVSISATPMPAMIGGASSALLTQKSTPAIYARHCTIGDS